MPPVKVAVDLQPFGHPLEIQTGVHQLGAAEVQPAEALEGHVVEHAVASAELILQIPADTAADSRVCAELLAHRRGGHGYRGMVVAEILQAPDIQQAPSAFSAREDPRAAGEERHAHFDHGGQREA